MDKIQEIEERLNNLSKRGLEGYSAKEHFQINAESDIDYLLAENKRYKEALEYVLERDGYLFVKEALRGEK